ncbi:MAG TPA: ATP-binding protein [Geobacteraceae bacterium]
MPRRTPRTIIRKSFRARVLAVLLAFIILVSGAFTGFYLYHEYQSLTSRLTAEGRLLVSMLAQTTRLSIFAENRQLIEETVTEMAGGYPHVLAVAVYNSEGTLLADVRLHDPVDSPVATRAVDRQQAVHLLTNLTGTVYFPQNGYYEFYAPVFSKSAVASNDARFLGPQPGTTTDRPTGLIRILLATDTLHQQLEHLVFFALLGTLLFLIIGSIVAYLVVREVARPLGQLTSGVTSLAGGDLTVTIPVETADEIGTLAEAFNAMVATLRERNHQVEESSRQLGAMNSILEQRVAERTAALEAANRELESFNYSASHDLRAPLVRLGGLCEAFREDCAAQLDEQGRRYLQRITLVGEQLGRVVSAMGTLFQVQRRELVSREVNMSEIASAVMYLLREHEPQRQIEVIIEPDITALGDAKLIWLALENLLGNAWKFTARQPAPRIEFGRFSAADRQVFYVRDNGIGFDMKYADKLFLPFQRLHNEADYPGTGVGLAIVQKIIERHDGRIWFESAEGQGTTGFFTLHDQFAADSRLLP